MQKLWSLLFLFVPVFSIAICVIAPSHDWWLPHNVSTFGHKVDHLFIVILWIVTIAFVATQGVLVFALFK